MSACLCVLECVSVKKDTTELVGGGGGALGFRGQNNCNHPGQVLRKCRPADRQALSAEARLAGPRAQPGPAPSSFLEFKFQTLTNGCKHRPSGTDGDAAPTCTPFQISLRTCLLAGCLLWENPGALFLAATRAGCLSLHHYSSELEARMERTCYPLAPPHPAPQAMPALPSWAPSSSEATVLHMSSVRNSIALPLDERGQCSVRRWPGLAARGECAASDRAERTAASAKWNSISAIALPLQASVE